MDTLPYVVNYLVIICWGLGDLKIKKTLFLRNPRSFKKWEIDKENNISVANLRNWRNIDFRMENEAGKDRQEPDQERHEGPGALPSDLDLTLYAKENLNFRKSLPTIFLFLIFQHLQIKTQTINTHTHAHLS